MHLSSRLYDLGRSCVARWRVVIGTWLLLLVAAGAAATTVGTGVTGAFVIPGTESQVAQDRLEQTFRESSGGSALLVAVSDGAAVTEEPQRQAVEAVVEQVRQLDGVDAVQSPFEEPDSPRVSDDGRAAIATVQFAVPGPDVPRATERELLSIAEDASGGGLTVQAGGGVFGGGAAGISPVELVGVVVALLVLGVVFRSVVAAAVPVLTALVGVGVAMGAVLTTTRWLDVIPSAPLLALMLGLAVGIDYALFIVARHRDQLAGGLDPAESAGRALATAGSAVVFAGLTVVVALAGLAVAGIPFLAVMGLSAAIAVGLAVAGALTLLPAVLGLLGSRLAPRESRGRRSRPAAASRPRGTLAGRWVALVTRFPGVAVVVVVAGLVTMALPATELRLALPDDGTEEVGSPARDTYDTVSEHFGPGYNSRLFVVGDIVGSSEPVELVDAVAAEIADLEGVASVPVATPNPGADTMLIQVVPEEGPSSQATAELVADIRALRAELAGEYGVEISVTGQTALGIDVSDRLARALLPFALLVVGLSLVLLAMVFRSVLLPVRAGLGYLLSVGAALGAVVAVYQWGWLAGPLHTVATGPVVSFLPIILMGILFGLAMDYEVFLVSRMREEYVRGGDPRAAVRDGFRHSARVVTAAAVIMISVFVAFVPEGDATLQPIAFGLAVGVLVDAFGVRMTLGPAVQVLLGRAAWWLPRWLDRALPAVDVEGAAMDRQVRLGDWPRPGAAGIHASGLSLRGRRDLLLDEVDLAVAPGDLLQVSGGSAAARTALVLAVTGRLAPSGGRLKVAGCLLPEQSHSLRRRVAVVRAVAEDDPVTALRRELTPVTEVLAVDGIDHVHPTGVRTALLDEVERARRRGVAAVVTGTAEVLAEVSPMPPSSDLGGHPDPGSHPARDGRQELDLDRRLEPHHGRRQPERHRLAVGGELRDDRQLTAPALEEVR